MLDAVLAGAAELDGLTVQVRKTYVSLVGPRRTFAVVKATTRTRVDLGLRLPRDQQLWLPPDEQPRLPPNQQPDATGRLLPAKSLASPDFTWRIALSEPSEVDDDVRHRLSVAWRHNLRPRAGRQLTPAGSSRQPVTQADRTRPEAGLTATGGRVPRASHRRPVRRRPHR